MKIKLICIGKTGKSFLEEGEKEYAGRLKHYIGFEKIELPDLKQAKKLTKEQVKELEGKAFLEKVNQGDIVYLLDEKGLHFSSMDFSTFIQKQMNTGIKQLVFVIGGAYGFSEELYARANGKISLSKMTFSHQMIRMIFLEQLYRGMTILKGEPYHHE
jgi:23S rRNA (pseudouridine1915-N3)-methyltransferase